MPRDAKARGTQGGCRVAGRHSDLISMPRCHRRITSWEPLRPPQTLGGGSCFGDRAGAGSDGVCADRDSVAAERRDVTKATGTNERRMKVLISGAAGFIGSHLVEAALGAGHNVTGVDALRDYYDPDIKRRNLEGARTTRRFNFVHGDLAEIDLAPLLDKVDVIFHLAAQPGRAHKLGYRVRTLHAR